MPNSNVGSRWVWRPWLFGLCGISCLVTPIATAEMPLRIARCLLDSYPGVLCDMTATDLVWCDGTRTPLRQGSGAKNHAEQLEHGDLLDQMSQKYTPFAKPAPLAVDDEPGRIRHEPFFAKLYGPSRTQVRKTLVPVRWLDGKVLLVQGKFGIAKQLAAVRDELAHLPPALTAAVRNSAGTFVWRTIHGTNRRSAHAYATAIDVGVAQSDFWQWQTPDGNGKLTWRNRIPSEVVDVFERHGFIWGGRWYHFDTMHFEFRPELLHPDCRGSVLHNPLD